MFASDGILKIAVDFIVTVNKKNPFAPCSFNDCVSYITDSVIFGEFNIFDSAVGTCILFAYSTAAVC